MEILLKNLNITINNKINIMRKILSIGFICLFFSNLFSQTLPSAENYIYSRVYLEPVTTESPNAKQIQGVQYFDGLGRKKQEVSIKSTPNGGDLVIPSTYDAFGRNMKNFLPIPQNTLNGNIHQVGESDINSYYVTSNAYSEKELESYSIGRVKQSAFPGEDWKKNSGHTVRYDYDISKSTDNVKKYTTTTNWDAGNKIFVSSISYTGNYGNSDLYKYSVTNEDNNTEYIYKDQLGHIVLVRKNEGTKYIDTYYVYNEYNQLSYIIPPLTEISGSVNQTTLDNLCYQYKYDDQNRLVEKKLPGKGWEYMLYDKQDRQVAIQDANLREKGQWLYTKYDKFGRVAITGISTGNTRNIEQGLVDLQGLNNVNRINTVYFNRQGIDVYYDNPENSYPKSPNWVTLLSLNYYDTYPEYSFNPSFPASILGAPVLTDNAAINGESTKSLPVLSLIKNIEDDNWTKNYTYYDKKGRIIGAHSINYLGGYTRIESGLDFAGTPKQVITRHKRLNADTERVITETFTYDYQNRLLVHKHKVDNNTEEVLAQNKYNELSQLETKKVGGINTATPLQTIDYAYNIRGWLTKINDPDNLGYDLFGYELEYNNPANESVAPKKYNGNIAEVNWKTSNDEVLRRYGYQYDQLNRLKKAVFQEPGTDLPLNEFYNENLTYDVNGNITKLERYQKPETGTTPLLIDRLNYTYNGNKLTRVFDSSGNYDGFKDDIVSGGYDSSDDYAYDSNGNMIRDDNKKISSIKYNYLDLPTEIIFSDNNKIYYAYRADGTKIRKTKVTYYAGAGSSSNEVIEYLDGFQYQGDSYGGSTPSPKLLFFPTAEGYYNNNINIMVNPYAPAVPAYIYQYKDQVGNTRLNYYKDQNTNSLVIDNESNYYPFGLEHKKYNTQIGNSNYQYKFQEQELQKETGWYSFKWRNYDPGIGRFFNIDPLSEKYAYQSHYNFSENRVTDGRELEGLEYIPMSDEQIQDILERHPDAHYDIIDEIPVFTLGTEDIEGVTISREKSESDLRVDADAEPGIFDSEVGEAVRFGLGFVPGVGSGLDIYEGARDGNWVQFGLGIGGLALDVATLGAGSIIAGGAKGLVREGIEKVAKDVAKELAEKESKDLALGLGDDLFNFAEHHGYNTYRDFSSGFNKNKILDAMNEYDNIHFNTTGFGKINFSRFNPNGPLSFRNYTNWEMHTIFNNPSLLNKTTFYNKAADGSYQILNNYSPFIK
ncbi:RHS repeat-associated protein [Chryseobacterium defluvii]|uniref:RHS repeat-associated protein n=1 Tax=Chryseobacterium defluvii TaxID=160396 RepID=A0A840KKB7_9FLAO|nr:DUF6443 domain-containing protein [Chryseobacterium defluvii]MBB4807950.1 RHS repeat-associated protein [Chryseobacterium defluvii]